jgi:SPP1 family predicted phage head-tail adaptor
MASRAPVAFEAGRLRERITVRRFTSTRTIAGGQVKAWATVPGMESIPAEVLGGGSSEAVLANRLEGTATYRITIRWREGIQARDQVLWRGLELNVLGPPQDPTGRREILQIIADTSARQGA